MLRRPDQLVLDSVTVPVRAHAWPGDPAAAQVVLLDSSVVPAARDFRRWAEQLAGQGVTTMRTGALASRHAAQAEAAGMHCIQELALLEARAPLRRHDPAPLAAPLLLPRRRPTAGGRWPTSPYRPGRRGERDLAGMAEVDAAAFGEVWRLDAAMLRDVCAATPSYRARLVRDPRVRLAGRRPPIGFLVSGRAGRTGYVQRLAVSPEHQRHGVAATLLGDSLTWMARWRADRVLVNTHVDNHAALTLYRSFGFVELPDRLRVYEGSTGG